jgi:putative hemolysin
MIANSLATPTSEFPTVLRQRSAWKSFRQSLVKLKLSKFQPKVSFSYDDGRYTIKTVQNQRELEQVLRLRKRIFLEEGLGITTYEAYDFDRFDLPADHILLMDNKTHEVVGTYRILCSKFTSHFYSQGEFLFDDFLMIPGVKIELGRACIDARYRNGAAISLVWKGIMRYASLVGARYMFGCTSIDTTDPGVAASVLRSLVAEGHYGTEYMIHVQSNHYFSTGMAQNEALTAEQIEKTIPSLLRSYLNAGAKVYGLPALDLEFRCSDLFTIIDIEQIPEKYIRRYGASNTEREV